MNPRLISPADLCLIALLAAAVGLALAASLAPAETGHQARVSVAGEEQASLALDEDQTAVFEGPLGESRVAIRDGEARFIQAPCSDRICMRRGAIHRAGESRSCVPNRVHLEITADEARYDSIHF